METGQEKHHAIGKHDKDVEQNKKEKPGCTPGRFAWLVWHLTSLSLYTELITVMQRAQFYSTKAREGGWERKGGINKTLGKQGKTTTEQHFLQKTKCCVVTVSLYWCSKSPLWKRLPVCPDFTVHFLWVRHKWMAKPFKAPTVRRVHTHTDILLKPTRNKNGFIFAFFNEEKTI